VRVTSKVNPAMSKLPAPTRQVWLNSRFEEKVNFKFRKGQ
jgi:hypothetical protein